MVHYLLSLHLMLYYINIALFYVALLMLDYYCCSIFDAALFIVALLDVSLF